MYLFDASSIVNLVKKGKVKPFINGVTIDLALYESLNAIWKEHKLLKRIDKDIAFQFIDIISDVFKVLTVIPIKGLEEEIFNLALEENLTIYDASYLYIAIKNKYTLVTDDQKLMSIASNYTNVTNSIKLLSSH